MIKILSTTLLDDLDDLQIPSHIQLEQVDLIDTTPTISTDQEYELTRLSKEDITAVFTSMNAVKAVGVINNIAKAKWKVYCLGQKTISWVEDYLPAARIIATAHNADELALKIVADKPSSPIHFFCGNIRRPDLPDTLKQANISFTEMIVYETQKNKVELNNVFDGILFYSPSAVEAFFDSNTLPEQTVCFAIGKTTAGTLFTFTKNKIITADLTGKKELLEMAIAHFTAG